jgi:calcium-dependent protein kinase
LTKLFYISPEVLEGNYDQACDIWSAGIMLHLLLVGIPPFFDPMDSEVINKIKKGTSRRLTLEKFDTTNPAWEALSKDAQDLISKMIVNRSKRINAMQILEHPWMNPNKTSIKNTLNVQSIKEFYQTGKLKRIALTALAFQASEKEIENLAKIFNELDKDGDGMLSYQELMTGRPV